jgi:hypothetical protein
MFLLLVTGNLIIRNWYVMTEMLYCTKFRKNLANGSKLPVGPSKHTDGTRYFEDVTLNNVNIYTPFRSPVLLTAITIAHNVHRVTIFFIICFTYVRTWSFQTYAT